ncbi:proteasome subunit alpha type-1-like [Teleopsis dalmanni]|uniref:proteasome subunit alpha type-1-like n=1 Tax=Teleopsis dalmanni TaxID=139649 RepID=UPI0018CF7ABF|nr:proteasome subunit alpha type-1-like [Teleopsis dalmanni]
MRAICRQFRKVEHTDISPNNLMENVSEYMYAPTVNSNWRIFGVGLLVVGCEDTNPYVYEVQTTGETSDRVAFAIGFCSSAANIYLKKNINNILSSNLDCLIMYGVTALRHTLSEDDQENITKMQNISIGVVGNKQPFRILDKCRTFRYLQNLTRDD